MDRWNRFAHAITHFAGTKRFFAVVLVLLAVWGIDGLLVGSSRPWELCVTCGVPILTLLMVVVLQHAQNRDSKAIQLKLNELLLALDQPDSKLIRAGHLGDEELQDLGDRYERKADAL